jgi:hypothetical protein
VSREGTGLDGGTFNIQPRRPRSCPRPRPRNHRRIENEDENEDEDETQDSISSLTTGGSGVTSADDSRGQPAFPMAFGKLQVPGSGFEVSFCSSINGAADEGLKLES